jgi:replicative DNA helicase
MEPKHILGHLMTNEDYHAKVMPHLQPDFFQDPIERKLFECMKSYFDRTKGKMAS